MGYNRVISMAITDSFWNIVKKPIIGQSPMDGVSDAPFRYITDKYGTPSMLFTEFTPVEGIMHGAAKLLDAFIHHKTSTPTLAQVYGAHAEDFYHVTFAVCEMGFDGVDINMGCPDKNVAKRGAGAGLILNPKLAKEIVFSVKKAVTDWANGKKMTETALPETIIHYVNDYKKNYGIDAVRRLLPVSVKTRIGFDRIVTNEWISQLLEAEPAAISVHGRTLKQLYSGLPDWSEIGKAAELIKKTKTLVLGNGNIMSMAEADEKTKKYKLDGVLIGRALFGNPWFFAGHTPTVEERINIALEHCEMFTKLLPNGHFVSLRKHLAWYVKGIDNSHELKVKLMQVRTIKDIRFILEQYLQQVGKDN